MIRALKLSELANRCGVNAPVSDIAFTAVTTDSRNVKKGDLFIALRGEKFDGHHFVQQVESSGACAAVVEQAQACALPQLVVDNTLSALGKLGALNRELFNRPVVAITGSSGKTTVKEMIAAILAEKCGDKNHVLATKGNLNNHIGVPLMLLQIEGQHEYAVIEMGASAVGEIAYLAQMAQPRVSVINNVGTAHVGGFGSVDNIAKGKAEIYHFLPKEGCAVINLDDVYSKDWLALNADKKCLTFSVMRDADIMAKNAVGDGAGRFSFELIYGGKTIAVTLPLIGKHNIANALAAASCCLALNVDLQTIKRGLEKTPVVKGRMHVQTGANHSCVIDDSYNANPASVCAAIDALAAMTGKKILVLGDMAELGVQAESAHTTVGDYAKQKNIDLLFAVGSYSQRAALAFGSKAQHFSTKTELAAACRKILDKNTVVLVKGSRSSGMEDVVNDLLNERLATC